jgi:serine/threonine protein kinase
LGDYELLRQIGRGGMGVVYQAHQFSLNRDVALKLVLDANQSSPRAIGRFQLEAEAAARLHHPNIVPIYEIAEVDEQHFLTMKLIEGGSLARRMSGGEFRVTPGKQAGAAIHQLQVRIARLVITVARAVHYAHEHGVLHRDIKPGNILIDEAGEPHLTDFGLAKLANDSATVVSESGGIAGTPAYMAPEQARGERLNRAADIYSLGVVLYELLTGKPPFTAATPLETLRLITDQEPANPTTTTNGLIDADLATISLKCLEKNPAARYASAKDLAEDLERWLKHEPIRARPLGSAARLQRWGRRNPVGTSLIAVLVLAFVSTTLLSLRLRVARQRAEKGEEVAQLRADAIRDGIFASIEQLWGSTNQQFQLITSEQLSAFLPTPKTVVDYFARHTRVTFGVSVTESPITQAQKYAKPFAQVEERMSELLGHPVLVDLKLFKFNTTKVLEVISAQKGQVDHVDFAAVGAYAYVRAKAREPGISLIARESDPKPSVFFIQKGSGITNFTQFKGKRLAFGDLAATISFWAKVHLARNHIFGSEVAWDHLNSKPAYLERLQREGLRNAARERSHSHAAGIVAVLSNKADIAVARREFVQDLTKDRLQIVFEYESTPQLWVASRKPEPSVTAAFRKAFIETKAIVLEGGANPRQITRLLPVEDSYFDPLRQVLTNEVARFEGDRPMQSRLDGPIEGDDE